jgi:type IV pilus assembly protein PilF
MLLLTACAGTGTKGTGSGSKARQAAELNTSMGREYMERGQLEIALDKLKKATSADPQYAPAHTMLGVLYERLGEPATAKKHYRLAVEAAPSNGDVNNNYGVFLCHSGDPKAAESYFEVAMKDPFYRTPAVVFANAGSCELESGNLNKAEQYLRQSLDYDQKFTDALLPMASVQFQMGDSFRARAFLQRFEQLGVENPQSLSLGWQIESSLGNTSAAEAYKQRLLNRFAESNEAVEIRAMQQP